MPKGLSVREPIDLFISDKLYIKHSITQAALKEPPTSKDRKDVCSILTDFCIYDVIPKFDTLGELLQWKMTKIEESIADPVWDEMDCDMWDKIG